MGIFNFRRKDKGEHPNILTVDISKIRNNLKEINPDLTDEEIETVVNEIKNNIENVVEKTEYELYDLPFIISHSIGNYLIKPNENRIKICKEIDMIVENYPEAKQAIKIHASTISYGSPEFKLDEYKWIITKKDSNTPEEIVEGAKKFLYRFDLQSGIKKYIYRISQDLIKYGDAFLEKIRDDKGRVVSFAYIPSNTVHIECDAYGNPVKFIQIKDLSINYKDIIKSGDKKKIVEFSPDEILHFNDGSFIGASDSVFKTLIPIWRAYRLLEQSLVIHRVTRSRRYVVFFLDVTGKEDTKVKHAIRAFVNKLRSFFNINIEEGIEYSYKSSIRTGEDLVIPITKESSTKMQIIPPDSGAHKIDDLNFFHKRLLNILFVDHLFGDKKSKNPDIDKALNRLIRVYQRQIAWTLEELYREVLIENGFEDVDISIIFPTPDSEEEIKIVDTLVRRLLLINQLTTVLGKTLPFNWVIEYVFKDLTRSELEELKELLLKKEEENSEDKEYIQQLLSFEPNKIEPPEEQAEYVEGEEENKLKNIFEKSKNLNEIINYTIEYLKIKYND